MSTPNYELLKDAYAIIGGIPDEAIDLSAITTADGDALDCGTICCAAGWLGHHPKFQELGLGVSPNTRLLTLNGRGEFFIDALAPIFNITSIDARNLFAIRGASAYDSNLPRHLSDKQVWTARVKTYLREHGQLREQLAAKVPA